MKLIPGKMKMKIILTIILTVLIMNDLQCQKKSKKITITGYVTDYRQFPVQNAMVIVDDIKTDYVTDDQGFYKARVNDSAVKIAVFTIGTGVKEEEIKGRTRINFIIPVPDPPALSGNSEAADNEVVNIGYGNIRKKDLTTSVGKIDNTNNKYATYTNIYDMIKGEVAGVQVQGNSIRIMGINSLNLSTEPLFVVDGMQVSTISNIPPQTVRSIEILKGSSAAIYGVRGANGVILITTLK